MTHWGQLDHCKGRNLALHSATTTAFVALAKELGYTLVLAAMPDLYFVRDDVLRAANVSFKVDRIPNGPRLPKECAARLHNLGFRSSKQLFDRRSGVVGALQEWAGA